MKQTDPLLFEDQTRFSVEEPMFEPTTGYPEEPEKQQKKEVKPLLKRKGVVVAIIAGSTLFVLLLLMVINSIIRNRQAGVPEASPLAVPNNSQDIPLLDQVNELNKELKNADPNQPTLAFPAVNLELTLDDKRN